MLKGVSQHGQLLALENAERQDRSSSDEAEAVIILGAKARGPAMLPKAKSKAFRLMKRQNVRDWTKLLCPSLAQGDQPLHLEEKRSVASVAFAVAPRTAHASSSSSSGQNGQQTMELASAAGGSIECINHDGQQEARVDTFVGAATSSGQLGELHPPALLSNHLDATYVENVKVTYEKHGFRGMPRSYERLRAKCPNPSHVGCGVQRSFSARLAVASGLGDLEPYDFVGAWLSQHGLHASKKDHESAKPSLDQVLDYARQRQWVSR